MQEPHDSTRNRHQTLKPTISTPCGPATVFLNLERRPSYGSRQTFTMQEPDDFNDLAHLRCRL
jgi:hypothetical protein